MNVRSALPAMVLVVPLTGCVVARSTYEEEVSLRQSVEAELASEQERARDLSERLGRREQERESLGKERVDLLNELEDLRQRLETTRKSLEVERRRREERESAIGAIQDRYSSLVEQLEGEVEKGQLEIHRLRGKLQIRALEKILFDSGSARIKPEGREVLATVAAQLGSRTDARIRIEGHTDDVPISTERFPSNWELSSARALEVLHLLVEHGIPPERLSASAMGAQQPIELNDTPEGRARNRRIEIVLLPEDEG